MRKGGTSLAQRLTEAINEIERAALAADLGIKAHAHKLRHARGYKLANDGHDTRAIQAYLGSTFRIRHAIPPWRPSGSRSFFAID